MPRVFHPQKGGWTRYAPKSWQAAVSMPTPVNLSIFGRVELVIGRLGAGKTTWAALRAKRLAQVTERTLATNGQEWPDEWTCVDSFEQMAALRDCVFVFDEVHLPMPSSKGLLGKDAERFLVDWMSMLRKRRICVVGTTQAWTRVATHYRQLVTCVWVAEPFRPGKLHVARGFDHPDEGGIQVLAPQWYGPRAAHIPTNASVWTGYNRIGEEAAAASAAAAPLDLPVLAPAVSGKPWHGPTRPVLTTI